MNRSTRPEDMTSLSAIIIHFAVTHIKGQAIPDDTETHTKPKEGEIQQEGVRILTEPLHRTAMSTDTIIQA